MWKIEESEEKDMKIGIVCASDRELAPFLPHIRDCRASERAMLRFYEGNIDGVPVVALFSGVCKVNAAVATQILIDRYGVDAVINAGTAGGMRADLALLDIAVATEVVYHDVASNILTEFHPWMESVYFYSDETLLALAKRAVRALGMEKCVFLGRMVTGEAFITDDGRDEINARFAPLTVDMETASVAHVCYVNRVPFLAIRCVTDTADHRGTEYFEENCARASALAKDLVVALIEKLAE